MCSKKRKKKACASRQSKHNLLKSPLSPVEPGTIYKPFLPACEALLSSLRWADLNPLFFTALTVKQAGFIQTFAEEIFLFQSPLKALEEGTTAKKSLS